MDLYAEGPIWAPLFGEDNHWVMVSQLYGNSATTCMDSLELLGKEPDWGSNRDNAQMKRLIMCCDF